MIDLARLRGKASDIREALSYIRERVEGTVDDFLADPDRVNGVKYQLVVAIEAALDICYHMVAKEVGGAPESYADCFRMMAEAGIIPETLGKRLVPMAKFRNLLVHRYAEVDDERVHEICRESLGVLDEYLEAVGAHLREREEE